MKSFRVALLASLLLGAVTARGDDTDIYITGGNINDGNSLVMMFLDWRPNLTSTVCTTEIEVTDPALPGATMLVNECEYLLGEFLPPAGEDGKRTFFELLRAALEKVVTPLTGVKLGLMLSHDHLANVECTGPEYGESPITPCSNGGFVFLGFKDMDDPVQKAEYFAKLAKMPLPQGSASHSYQGKEVYFEFFRYLTGQDVHNGHNGWTDYGTNNEETPRNIDDPKDTEPFDTATGVWDSSVEDETGRYISPLADALSCTKLYAINVLFQVSNQEDDSDDDIVASKANQGMGGIDLSGNRNSFPTVIEYLNDQDLADGSFNSKVNLPGKQNVISYFLVDETKINVKTTAYAEAGGSGNPPFPLSDDPKVLLDAINDIFKQILSVSTTFVSPSVPVNVFNRARTLNEVFIALFEAEQGGKPTWVGNLKKLKIGKNELGDTILVDAQNPPQPAVAVDGRIKDTALTYWTLADELPDPAPDDTFVAGKDGRTVARGGAGSVIPGYRSAVLGNTPGTTNPAGDTTSTTHRKVFTEPDNLTNGTLTDLRALNADATTAAVLLASDTLYQAVMNCSGCSYTTADATDQARAETELVELLKFARGLDVDDEDDDSIVDEARSWIVSDPLHSRPLPLNYGAVNGFTAENPDVRILMATNDGFLHMFQAADNSGVETWAFMPRDVIDDVMRLRANTAGVPVHPYLLDGASTALVIDNDADGNIEIADKSDLANPLNDRVVAFIGERRAGKRYYALDISEPDDPHMLWSIGKGDAGYEQMGQTWSTPRVGKLLVDLGSGPVEKYVLFIGGGYNGDDAGDDVGDLGKDERDESNPFVGGDDDEGNAIFIVDAFTGTLIWKAVDTDVAEATASAVEDSPELYVHPDLEDSIPSDLSTIDSDADGYIDRAYVGDTGGVVWRIDTVGADRTGWRVTKLASIGRHYSNTNADDRRFFHRVDFVRAADDAGSFDAVLVGSGDRPYPKGRDVENYFYMFKDRYISSGIPPTAAIEHDDVADLSDNCLADGDDTDCTDTDADTNLLNGWKIKLDQCEALASTGNCGEKSLARPLTLKSTVFFTSYIPPSDAPGDTCSPAEGGGLFYAVGLQDASPVLNFDQTNDGSGITLERFEQLASSGIPAQLVPLGGGDILRGDLRVQHVPGGTGSKTFWYERYFQ